MASFGFEVIRVANATGFVNHPGGLVVAVLDETRVESVIHESPVAGFEAKILSPVFGMRLPLEKIRARVAACRRKIPLPFACC